MAKSVKYKLFNSRFTAVMSVSMVLLLLGITSMVLLMGKNLSEQVRENFIFKIALKEGVGNEGIKRVRDSLLAKPYVKEAIFVSKEQAVKDLTELLGEDPMESLDVNPLPNSFEVSLKAPQTSPDSLEKIEADLKDLVQISSIDYPHDLLTSFSRNIRTLSIVFIAVAALLLLISFALINNTIRLLVYANRFLIYTMKQVGATHSFIRRPYMRQGLVIGLVASVLAVAMLFLLIYGLGDISEDIALFVDVNNTSLFLTSCLVIVVSGLVITEIATYMAVNKYVRQKHDTLYLI